MARSDWPHYLREGHRRLADDPRGRKASNLPDLPVRRGRSFLRSLPGRHLSQTANQPPFLPSRPAYLGALRSAQSRKLNRGFRALDGTEAIAGQPPEYRKTPPAISPPPTESFELRQSQ